MLGLFLNFMLGAGMAAASIMLLFFFVGWYKNGWRVALYKVFCPLTWGDIYPINLDWDEALNLALDKFNLQGDGYEEYYIIAGPFKVWLSSSAYGKFYGTTDEVRDQQDIMPKWSTRQRLKRLIQEQEVLQKPSLTTVAKATILSGVGNRKD